MVVEEYLLKELAFKPEDIKDMDIRDVQRPRKQDSNTVYVTIKDAELVIQIFWRSAQIQNNNLRITNFVAPQFFERFSALQLKTKIAREQDDDLRTRVQLSFDDLILLEKHIGERGYSKQPITKYGDLPEFNNSLMWPLPDVNPVQTPPKGRSHKKDKDLHKRMRSTPNMSSSMELSPKRNCLHASSSENYVTDEDETNINMEKMIEKLEKKAGRRKKKGKKN